MFYREHLKAIGMEDFNFDDYIKKNNISLKNAVDNDMFSSVPDVSRIFELKEIKTERAANE